MKFINKNFSDLTAGEKLDISNAIAANWNKIAKHFGIERHVRSMFSHDGASTADLLLAKELVRQLSEMEGLTLELFNSTLIDLNLHNEFNKLYKNEAEQTINKDASDTSPYLFDLSPCDLCDVGIEIAAVWTSVAAEFKLEDAVRNQFNSQGVRVALGKLSQRFIDELSETACTIKQFRAVLQKLKLGDNLKRLDNIVFNNYASPVASFYATSVSYTKTLGNLSLNEILILAEVIASYWENIAVIFEDVNLVDDVKKELPQNFSPMLAAFIFVHKLSELRSELLLVDLFDIITKKTQKATGPYFYRNCERERESNLSNRFTSGPDQRLMKNLTESAQEAIADVIGSSWLEIAAKFGIHKHLLRTELLNRPRLIPRDAARKVVSLMCESDKSLGDLYTAFCLDGKNRYVGLVKEALERNNSFINPRAPQKASMSYAAVEKKAVKADPEQAALPKEDDGCYHMQIPVGCPDALREQLDWMNKMALKRNRFYKEAIVKLESDDDDDLQDEICSELSMTVPDCPVYLGGHLYDLQELLDMLAKGSAGVAKRPYCLDQTFSILNITPAIPVQKKIQRLIGKVAPKVQEADTSQMQLDALAPVRSASSTGSTAATSSTSLFGRSDVNISMQGTLSSRKVP